MEDYVGLYHWVKESKKNMIWNIVINSNVLFSVLMSNLTQSITKYYYFLFTSIVMLRFLVKG